MTLEVQIQKRYGDFRLDADFGLRGGEALALLGASGCGKSVTLKCVAGIDRPDKGRIVLNGKTLFDSEAGIDLPPQKRHVGFLFQQYALFPNMTVEQNIAVCLRHLKKGQRQRRLRELLAVLRLEEVARLYPRQISGGQQQRTALARILASEPQAILLDEPFSALDSFLKWQLELELQEVLERFPGPVLWVSHDQGEVRRNCRRVCVLDAGKSSPVTDMEDLMANPATVSAARLSGCRNFVSVRPGPEPGLVEASAWGLTLQVSAPWREGVTTLAVRGDRVRLAAVGESDAFPCRVVRAVEDVNSVQAVLCPEKSEGPLLQMELPKDAWARLANKEHLWAAVSPEDWMLLR